MKKSLFLFCLLLSVPVFAQYREIDRAVTQSGFRQRDMNTTVNPGFKSSFSSVRKSTEFKMEWAVIRWDKSNCIMRHNNRKIYYYGPIKSKWGTIEGEQAILIVRNGQALLKDESDSCATYYLGQWRRDYKHGRFFVKEGDVRVYGGIWKYDKFVEGSEFALSTEEKARIDKAIEVFEARLELLDFDGSTYRPIPR